jgi:hypothetical protein
MPASVVSRGCRIPRERRGGGGKRERRNERNKKCVQADEERIGGYAVVK